MNSGVSTPKPSMFASRKQTPLTARGPSRVGETRPSANSIYRSFLESAPNQTLLDVVTEQIYQWLDYKHPGSHQVLQINAAPIKLPGSEDRTAQLLRHGVGGGQALHLSMSVRNERDVEYLTDITAFEPNHSARGWVATEVRNNENEYCGTPRIASSLLNALDLFDGSTQLTSRPSVVGVATDVDTIVGTLVDPTRRYPVIVAGTSTDTPRSIKDFTDEVAKWTKGIAGQGQVFVLTPDMSMYLAELLPHSLLPQPSTLRTYLPHVDPRNPFDGIRHRILSARSLETRSESQLRGIITSSLRAAATSQTFPRRVEAVTAELNRVLRDERLRTVILTPTPEPASLGPLPSPSAPSPLRTHYRSDPSIEQRERVQDRVTTPTTRGRQAELLIDRILTTLGARELTSELVEQVVVQLSDPTAELDAFLAEFQEQDRAADELRTALETAQADLDDAQDTNALLEDELLETNAKLLDAEARSLYFQRQLAKVDAASAYTPPAPFAELDDDFLGLLVKVDELDHVIFTGDPSLVDNLAASDRMNTEAKMAWRAFCTLDSFASHYLNGGEARTLKQFIESNPDGTCYIKPGRWAPTESEQTLNQFGDARIFPVPRTVNPSGQVLMKAHFKLSTQDTRAPRMYYYDDLDNTEKIYVGYIGRHLPNTKTSNS